MEDVRSGDLIVGHPCLTQEGLGGCVGIVLRHSPIDTLCLVLNVDSGVSVSHGWHSSCHRHRPAWRLHVHLPPLATNDQRRVLPTALQHVPLRWGGPYPTPLHILHTTPLALPTARHSETFQRLTNHEVHPGLWCSYVDEPVLEALTDVLKGGDAPPSRFGAYVGMLTMEPGKLENYMIMNHWFVARPMVSSFVKGRWSVPPQGWGTSVWGRDYQWIDDRQWDPWRSIVSHLGGEFAGWAGIDWLKVRTVS